MANQQDYIQIAPDGTGKKLDAASVETNAGTVYREVAVVGDPVNPDALANIEKVSSSKYGMVVVLGDISKLLKKMLNAIAIPYFMDRENGYLKGINVIDTINGGSLTSVNTVSTVTAVTTVSTVTSVTNVQQNRDTQYGRNSTWATGIGTLEQLDYAAKNNANAVYYATRQGRYQ